MQQGQTSSKRQLPLRLVDSSIWIAFHRRGHTEALLRLPGLGISRGVLLELRRGGGSLPSLLEDLVVQGIGGLSIDDEPAATVALCLSQRGISMQDAAQAAYAAVHSLDGVCLYMRDTEAEIAGGSIGADIRDHHRLVDDMLELHAIDGSEARSIRADLEAEFPRPRKR